MSDFLVDWVTILSFVDHFGEKKLIQVEYDSFLHILSCKKKGLMACSRKQMNLFSTLLIYSGVLVLLLCLKIDQNEEFTENHQSLTPAENEENSLLIDFVTTALEKSTEGQVTAGDLEEQKEKAELIMNDDLTIDLQLSQRNLKSTNITETAQVFI